MKLTWLDCETTSAVPDDARIVSLCIWPDGGERRKQLVNPGVPIPPEATAVHGITDGDVRDAPPFRRFAVAVQALIDGAVLGSFNGRRFDSIVLDSHLRRAGQPGLARGDDGRIVQPELDLYRIWFLSESRTLVAAAKRFAGVDLEGAHSADADTAVLPGILAGMRREFGLEDRSVEELCALCVPADEVDRAGKFKRREDGMVVFAFGKVRGTPVHDDPGFLRWMLKPERDFAEDTLAFARQFLRDVEEAEQAAELFALDMFDEAAEAAEAAHRTPEEAA